MRIITITAALILFINFISYSQCMEVDISVTRTCVDGAGVITVLTGDLDSVTYSIDGGATFINTPQFTGLNIGVYSIVAKDTTGCELNFTAEIEELLEVGPIVVTKSCAGNTGVIDVKGNKGKPLYQFSFDGGLSYYTDSIKDELAAGTYDVFIKDSYGCEVNQTVIVEAFPTISPTITTTNEQCNGIAPGDVNVTFTDGANYDFSLDGGPISNATAYTNNTLLAGFYVLTVTDMNDCTAPFQFEVEADLVDDTVQITHELCHQGNGAIEVFGFLGVTPYEYSLDNGTTYSPSGSYSSLSQGEQIIFIKDATGCVKKDTIYVTNFGGVTATPSVDDTVCLGNSTIISVGHNAGVSANYQWSNGLSNIQTHTVSPTATTTYSVIVTDNYGCDATVETIVYVENFPVVSLSETQIHACIGDDLDLMAFGADRYEWSTGSTTDMINYIAVGNETITVTGYNGQCSDQEQLVIIIKPSPTAVASSNVTSINTGSSISFSNSGSVTSTTNWDFADGSTSMVSNPVHQFDFAGAYMVMLTSQMGGCEAKDSILVYVGTVSIEENKGLNVLVYPNPARDYINVEVDFDSQLRLFSLNGNIVSDTKMTKGSNYITLNNLSTGIYIGEVKSDRNYYQFKLVVE